jgi:subtilisin family serine protease
MRTAVALAAPLSLLATAWPAVLIAGGMPDSIAIVRAIEREIVVAFAPVARDAAGAIAFDRAHLALVSTPDSATAVAALAALARDPAVAWAEPNRVREACVSGYSRVSEAPTSPGQTAATTGLAAWHPDDPLYRDGRQWGLGAIGAPSAWVVSRCDPATVLAIADTGMDPAHPDLAWGPGSLGSRIVHAINVTGEPPGAWADEYGHGTPVAGVAVALANNGATFDSLGIAGVAGGDGALNPGARVMPVRITRSGTGLASSFDIAAAIVHAVARGARVVNVSFAGRYPSALERAALLHAIARGCLVVAAIGNRGASAPEAPMYPAAYAADGLCLAVGAMGADGARAVFSSYGPGLDLIAPGVDVWTTFMTYPSAAGAAYPGYVRASGTSFAAPFASGAAALLASARPDLDGSDLRALLRESARDAGEGGPDRETGRGVLDAGAGLAAVGPGAVLLHDEVPATAFRALGEDTLVVGEGGPGTLDRYVGARRAVRFEATASVAIPDSFAAAARVWPRIAGTFALRGDFRQPYFVPWAEVAARDGRSVTLRGHLFRIADEAGDDAWVPLAPDQIRFGYTVLGPRAEPRVEVAEPASVRLAAAPNPFRDRVRLRGLPGAAVAIVDLAGRRVCEARLDAEGVWVWDGRDASGRELAPGLYLARGPAPAGGRATRLVRVR